MRSYLINKRAQATGEHEVHTTTCIKRPFDENSDFLGVFADCHKAIEFAKTKYEEVDGCAFCCPDCHLR